MKTHQIITALLTATLSAALLTTPSFAAGELSASKTDPAVNETFTVTANLGSIAAWNVHLSATGPVTGCTLAEVDTTPDAQNATKSFSTDCATTGAGDIVITLTGDTTTADGTNTTLSDVLTITVTNNTTGGDTGDDTGGNTGDNTGDNGGSTDNTGSNDNTQTPATYDGIIYSVLTITILSGILAAIYLHNRSKRTR